MRNVRKLLSVALLPLLILVLASCAITPVTDEEPMAGAPMAEEEMMDDGEITLTIGMNELVTSLDPPTDWAIAATWIHMNLFDCLIWRNRETAEFEPWLAESYENINDTTWRLKLREGVKFHNGETLTTDAVVWTYSRIIEASRDEFITYNQWLFIDQMNVIDDYNIEIVTATPEPAFLSKMAGTGCGIQAPEAGRAQAESGADYMPVGTGPLMFDSWIKDDSITLRANEDYWLGKPDVDVVIWRNIPEVSTRVANLLTGDVDMVVAVPPQDWERVNANEGTNVVDFLTTRVMLLALRVGPSSTMEDWAGPTADRRIREAISLSINRADLLELIDGMGVPVLSRITPPTLGSDAKYIDQLGEYNPEKAAELLAEVGYDGEELTFHSASRWLAQKEVSEALEAMMEAVGLNVDLQVLDVTTFNEQVYRPNRNEEIYMTALGNSFFDPWITVLSEISDRRERSGWHGPNADAADALIRAAAVNMDPEARGQQYVDIQALIAEDIPYVYLYQMRDTIGLSESFAWDPPLDGFIWLGNIDYTENN
jgi:peptide/nickel transport system substrate-binding protein